MSSSSISRRRFTKGLAAAGGVLLFSRRLPAADRAGSELRQFHGQPADSPLNKRLIEMWAAVEQETGGKVRVQVFPGNDKIPGGDPVALQMLVSGELDFYTVMGGLLGPLVPAAEIQEIPFAFRSPSQAYAALDGKLGAYLREELKAKGAYALPHGAFENGIRQITCSTHPIRTVEDMEGLKIRTPKGEIFTDLFQSLGANPMGINSNQLYKALETREVEAQENPLNIVVLFRIAPLQKYVSMTNHMWSGFNLLANGKLWQSFPAGTQAIIERNVAKYTALQRADNDSLNASGRGELEQQGLVFNPVDTAPFRARLGGFYARWKNRVGSKAWGLLEEYTGKFA